MKKKISCLNPECRKEYDVELDDLKKRNKVELTCPYCGTVNFNEFLESVMGADD